MSRAYPAAFGAFAMLTLAACLLLLLADACGAVSLP